MREIRQAIAGYLLINEPLTNWASISGSVRVRAGGKFYNRGVIYGSLVESDGKAYSLEGKTRRSTRAKARAD